MDSIGDLMTGGLRSVVEDAALSACAQAMWTDGIRHLVVCARDQQFLGVVTDFGLERALREDHWERDARALSEPWALVCSPEAPVVPVLLEQQALDEDAAVVLDRENRAIGIFTEHDAIRMAARTLTPQWTVRDGVEPGVITIAAEGSVAEAIDRMHMCRFRHLPVVDGSDLVGVVSFRDLAARPAHQRARTIRSIAPTREILVTRWDTPILIAVRLMLREKVGCLPVVEPGRGTTGVLTRSDVIRTMVRQLLHETPRPRASRFGPQGAQGMQV